jgi:hypothetical protein
VNPQAEYRIGDADREQAVSALGEHYLAGRLTQEEYDERAAAAWSAKTRSQLQPLFRDLPPQQRPPVTTPPSPPRGRSSKSRGRQLLLAIPAFWLVVGLVVLMAMVGAPWWVWLILGWMWFSGMFASIGLGGRRRRCG